MTLTENNTITESRSTADSDTGVEKPQNHPHQDRPHRVVSWILIGVAVAGLAFLIVRLVGSDDEPVGTPSRAQVTDAKDQPSYRLPTSTRSLTTGDAKDQPGYRLPTTTWSFTSGDAKDQPGYRSSTTTWSFTSGDAKDQPGYRLPTSTRELTAGDAKDQPGYQSPTANP